MTSEKLQPWDNWRSRLTPRKWQSTALKEWRKSRRGIVSVVTGGGKTKFAELCITDFFAHHKNGSVVIIVPTTSLLDQWYVGLQEDLGISQDDISCFSGDEKSTSASVINLMVVNSARTKAEFLEVNSPKFLIVDECHRAGSPENSKAIRGEYAASLGLSATPIREFDDGFEKYLLPALGPLIFEYDYAAALEDEVLCHFEVTNLKVDFLPDEEKKYKKLTSQIARLFQDSNPDPDKERKIKILLQRRASISAAATMRIPSAARIVESNRNLRTIVFHERISAARIILNNLQKRGHRVTSYDSKIPPSIRRDNLRLFRSGVFDVLVCCRALDEGLDIPEASVAIIASSTASRRQRIQRLGRVLRPSKNKTLAKVYTIYVTDEEKRRLVGEQTKLADLAEVKWGHLKLI